MRRAGNIRFRLASRFVVGLFILWWGAGSTLYGQSESEDTPPTKIQETSEEIEKRAKAVADALRDKGMVDLTKQMGSRVRGALGITGSEAGREKETNFSNERSEGSFRAILFASQSVPLGVLRAYAAQLEKSNGVMVFRGIPGGIAKIQPIVELTHKIIVKDPGCNGQDCDVYGIGVIIDPLMFRANGVERVPAVTTVDSDPFAAYCERPDEEAAAALGSFVTYGDAHLSGHFQALVALGDRRALSLLKTLQNTGEVR
ncbi:type-F conjugative transfer system pilin assembly protein TrbC [Kordiimonas aquimaris]|uniref:type-F conjugative transfer system pilin assembly protein TrbC n=1 Tax=Kordiimonas aquimaris TaxID=707591 RepID=UPI0021D1B097|nr:type-F conjugative transfer system pilin assembly protein TrbC [Kordiimonas aquimaris]